ncbi:MAG: tRNA (adenosine(37)-N6)-threonylcarbamoyltransferase complex dimerization subunit type 1 TsaB [Lachnospiraceae bacterium]|nr:tRNA (adenosine(37)-N6)-threonylcarbamoyltransferase complex dimerization subunit type 1 TsaB [Lachnospiraceae bacterium]
MKLLVLESSGLVASVALMEENSMICEFTMNHKKTHSQTLLPMVDEMMKITGFNKKELDAVAISKGPGSFTGLRIGSATAKGLAQALNIPVVSISSLEGLAANLYGTSDLICPIMDARRSQVYAGVFQYEGDRLHARMKDDAIAVADLIEVLNEKGEPVIFLGDGVPVYQKLLEEGLKVPFRFAPAHMNRQRAGAVGMLAVQYYNEGRVESARDHKPEYLRKSQAERELMEKQNGSN